MDTETEQLTDIDQRKAQSLLCAMTAKQWVFYGNLLVAENSEQFDEALLAKLKKLAESGAVHLEPKEDGTCEITPLDVKKLESFAAEEMITGINSLTDLNCSYDDGSTEDSISEEQRGPRIKFKGIMTPAQLMRLYRLTKQHILNAHISHTAIKGDKIQAECDISGLSFTKLEEEVAVEKLRRDEGQEAATALTELTGASWVWEEGLSIALAVALTPELYKQLEMLERQGIATYRIEPILDEQGNIQQTLCHIQSVDLAKLRATMQETASGQNTQGYTAEDMMAFREDADKYELPRGTPTDGEAKRSWVQIAENPPPNKPWMSDRDAFKKKPVT